MRIAYVFGPTRGRDYDNSDWPRQKAQSPRTPIGSASAHLATVHGARSKPIMVPPLLRKLKRHAVPVVEAVFLPTM